MDDDTGWQLPAFDPAEALQRLKRELRALGLSEREGRFERRGALIARAALADGQLQAARVKRPTRSSPDWLPRTLRHQADLRDFVADLKKQLAVWGGSDD